MPYQQGLIASTTSKLKSCTGLVEARRLSNSELQSKIVNYVINRQNEDGGYAFCQGSLESSDQDTYYGLAILSQLNTTFPNIEKTLRFLEESCLDTIYSVYYTAKAQLLLGKGINENLMKEVRSILRPKRYFGSTDFFSEVSSEFTTTFMTLELADLLKFDVSAREVAEWLLSFKNEDGGFGTRSASNINSTYYAIASLLLLKEKPQKLSEVIKFVRMCEKPYGGFTVIPMNFTPYMEHTYYALMTLDLLGEKCRYPSQTEEWVLNCQNNNGGFARSDLGNINLCRYLLCNFNLAKVRGSLRKVNSDFIRIQIRN